MAKVGSKDYCLRNVIRDICYTTAWGFKKIGSRDPLYLPRRLSYSLKRRFVDLSFPLFRKSLAEMTGNTPKDTFQLLMYFRQRNKPRFHFRDNEIDEILTIIPEYKKNATIAEARDIVKHRFTHKGVGPITLDPIDWEFEPPRVAGWRWAANRHFLFSKLGFAYWYTRDRCFADTFIALSSSWIDAYINRIGRLKWDHPFEVGARINAWLWAYFLFLPCPYWSADAHHRFLSALELLTEYLFRTIEYHNPGNHILLEAKALALCAGLFPEFRRSSSWEKRAWRIIKQELQKQICEDGVHAERSTMYHRIVAGELAELMLFCKRNDRDIETLEKTVSRMADFEAWITRGQRNMPVFGDAYREDSYYRFSAPAIAEATCSDVEGLTGSSDHGDQTDWVLGVDYLPRLIRKESILPTKLSRAFPNGGYFVSRWGWNSDATMLVWDCGQVGYYANPYHGHLDALSFTLSVDGVELLVDPGIDELNIYENRKLRGTSSHNTVLVDCENQSILAALGKRNEIWRSAKVKLHFWATDANCDVMIGSHDGYRRLPDPVLHKRLIVSMHDKYWLILDRLEGRERHSVKQRFHVAPNAEVEWTDSQESLVVTKECRSLLIHPIRYNSQDNTDIDETITLEKGLAQVNPNKIEEMLVINIQRKGTMPFEMAVIIAPAPTEITEVVSQSPDCQGNSGFRLIELRRRNFRESIFLCTAEKRTRLLFREWVTDAQLLILSQKEGNLTDVYALGATVLSRGALDLVKQEDERPMCHFILDESGAYTHSEFGEYVWDQ